MKRGQLIAGLVYTAAGLGFCLCAIFLDTGLDSLLWGFAGAGIGPGLLIIYKYLYWSRPKRRGRYAQKLEEEAIEHHDERKTMLRDRAARIVFLLNWLVLSAAMVVFSILGQLERISFHRPLVLTLGSLWILQLILYYAVYHALEKRH